MDLKHSHSVKLNDGNLMPVVGFGTFASDGVPKSKATEATKIAIDPGGDLMPKDASGKIIFDNVDIRDTWEALEKCKDLGLTKSIGVSNFNRKVLELILNKPGLKYKPVCNQVECHPYLNQSKLLEFCKSKDIVLVAYSALGSHRDPNWIRDKSPYLLEEPILKTIAEKHNRSPGQVALRYQLQRGVVVLAKSFNEKRIKENFEHLKKKSMESTKIAIDVGFRHIDCSHFYQNEEELGQAIRSKIEDGTVKREDIFYTSKLWSTCHRPELVRPSLESSLRKLKLDYVDLYLIHFPVSLKAMEKCKDAGLAKSIGVSNFNRRLLEMILKKPGLRYKPVCNQVECHPYLNQSKLLDYCKMNDIILVAYGALGTQRYKNCTNEDTPVLLEDPVLCAMAKKYKRTPALIALRYQLQRGIVVLAKSFNEEHIRENMQPPLLDQTFSAALKDPDGTDRLAEPKLYQKCQISSRELSLMLKIRVSGLVQGLWHTVITASGTPSSPNPHSSRSRAIAYRPPRSAWPWRQHSPQTPTWPPVVAQPLGTCVSFGVTMGQDISTVTGCGRTKDLDLVPSSSPGSDVTMAPSNSPEPWHQHGLQWYQEPHTSPEILAVGGP
ncbi:Aldo-keto reductase family 1 member C18 [Microtus ochrogaster]|uniref:Aldo-keto reductase family 1 member C18 n=1 Tax=Microtus ochrogaster TaxID=79684 RepID=A0A8J6GHE2_MICOH|nr:Aldo-keto reductase family 1 member C18 [Microtus ochrogaster]